MKYLALFLSLFIVFPSVAQLKKETFLLKYNGQEVNSIDSADFIRIVSEPEGGSKLYNLYEHYKNGAKKTIGRVSAFRYGLSYDGLLEEFYENGTKKSTKNYENKELIGEAFLYHQNGKLAKREVYEQTVDKDGKITSGRGVFAKSKLIFKQDSLGIITVEDGNGYDITKTDFEKDTLVEEGNYKDGVKIGTWKGKYLSGKSSFVESYNAGNLIEGINTTTDTVYRYKELQVMPQYVGGIDKFYKLLGKKVRFPSDALDRNITGIVITSFVIEKDGTLTNVKVVKSVYPSIDKEAVRVVSSSPKWIAAVERGAPVKVKYNIPITFGYR